MKTTLWWTRRDLRLHDNRALAAAATHAGRVVPVFVLDPALLSAPDLSGKRLAFLLEGLRRLDADLRDRGSRLIVRQGDPADELAVLLDETSATAIYAERDPWPYARRRDSRVARSLPLHLVDGLTLHPPEALLKADGQPYRVFTPFRRKWKALPLPGADSLVPAPDRWTPLPALPSLPIPARPALPPIGPFPPGDAEAQRRLHAFVAGPQAPISRYAETRDRLDRTGTSQLSPYLRFGMLSARQAVASARHAVETAADNRGREGAEAWLDELIWREFYMGILHHFPDVLEQSFRANLRGIAWDNDEAAFAAWCEGRTGYPVVDAAMRQLSQTGWMPNRARMIVASFLVKDLLIDWRWGEHWFMQHLVDGDPAANNGGWQWTAGTGTDAAPYFRVFNPVSQGQKHDPEGTYVRRWVPELQPVPNDHVHHPWTMPTDVQRQVGCVMGKDYPDPIVDHAWARERAITAYTRAREAFQE